MRAVGFGCFWFGIKGGRPADSDENFDPKDHLEKTKQALSRIPNITKISVEGDDDIGFGSGNPIDLPNIPEDLSFFPAYALLSINIEIYIPQRLQNQLKYLPEDAPVETENFSVLINYDYEIPFTIVSYETDEVMPDSSDAVVVIRKYLEREFKDDLVTFCSLGPSPFHADLLLKPSASVGDPTFSVHDLSDPGRGYERFEVRYSSKIKNEGVIMASFTNYIGPFLSSYYALERDRVNLMFLSENADEHLEKLLEIERARGIRRIRKHLFSASNVISEILAAILQIEIEKSRSNNFF